MSHFREDTLRALQDDLRWPLLVDEYFSDIGVVDYRVAELDTEINKMLTVMSEKTGKCGVGVVVMPLRARDDFLEASPRHPLTVRATYLVLEHPTVNWGPAGIRKPALSCCSRIRHILKHYILGGFASPLVPDAENHIVPVEDPAAPVAYEVNFNCFEHVDQSFFKVMEPQLIYDDVTGIMEIFCDTPDSTIYYSLDGSYPHALNGSTTYSGPITMEGEWFIRAGAFKESHIPSNIAAARSPIIGDQGAGTGGLGLIS